MTTMKDTHVQDSGMHAVCDRTVRLLRKDEKIPYNVLLLADETEDAINAYIYDSDIYVTEEETTIIGLYVLQIIEKNVAEIKNIAVDKSSRGRVLDSY
jgi:hypothetical protein